MHPHPHPEAIEQNTCGERKRYIKTVELNPSVKYIYDVYVIIKFVFMSMGETVGGMVYAIGSRILGSACTKLNNGPKETIEVYGRGSTVYAKLNDLNLYGDVTICIDLS